MSDGETVTTAQIFGGSASRRGSRGLSGAAAEFMDLIQETPVEHRWMLVRELIAREVGPMPPEPPKQPTTRSTDAVVYYMRRGDMVKIGTTINIDQRRRQIAHDELLATEPGGRDVEHVRHLQFADQRRWLDGQSEWFVLDDEIKAHIASL